MSMPRHSPPSNKIYGPPAPKPKIYGPPAPKPTLTLPPNGLRASAAGDPGVLAPGAWGRTSSGGAVGFNPSAVTQGPQGLSIWTANGLTPIRSLTSEPGTQGRIAPAPKPKIYGPPAPPAATSATPSYAGNIKYFGSPEAYAQAIMAKEAAGIPLSDPEAARQFKTARPDLFARPTVSPIPTPTPAPPPMRPPTPTAPGDVGPRQPALPPPAAMPPPAYAAQELPTQAQQGVNEITTIINDLLRTAQEGASSPSGAALVNQYFNAWLTQYDSLAKQIQDNFQSQMGGIDPMTNAALQSIRASVDQQRSQLRDEMNRRGLLQSGIWVDAETRLARNQLTAEEQLLATRLQQATDRLNQAMMNLAQMRLKAIQDFGIQAVQAADRELLRKQQFALSMGNLAVNLRGQDLANTRFYDQLAQNWAQFDQSQNLKMLQNQAQWSGINPLTGEPTLDWQKLQSRTAYQQGQLQQGAERNRLLSEANRLKAEAQTAQSQEDALFAKEAADIWKGVADGWTKSQAITNITQNAPHLPPRVVSRLLQEVNRAYTSTILGVPTK